MAIIKSRTYTSFEIKCALTHYFRIKRNMLCADELQMHGGYVSDFVADNGRHIVYEVEIKTNVYDLMNNEIKNKKEKHKTYGDCKTGCTGIPNMYYICVPVFLKEEAEKFVEKINLDYGIMVYTHYSGGVTSESISVYRQAKRLNKDYSSIKHLIYKKSSWFMVEKFDMRMKLKRIKDEVLR